MPNIFFSFRLALFALVATFPFASSAQPASPPPDIKLGFALSFPNCGPYSWDEGPQSITTYCTEADIVPAQAQPALRLVKSMSDITAVAHRLLMSQWAISHEHWIKYLCGLLGRDTREVSIYIHKTSSTFGRDALSQCASEKQVASITVGQRGFFGDISSFHPKILAIEDGTRFLTLLSTGNMTQRSERNIDASVLVQETGDHRFFDWHSCVQSLWKRDTDGNEEFEALRKLYVDCRNDEWGEFPIRPFLLPFDRARLLTEMAFYLGRSKSVSIITQSADSRTLKSILELAAATDIEMRYVRDDDLFWARPGSKLMNSSSELNDWQLPLTSSNRSKLRYLITNHLDPDKNFLHMKSLSFDLVDGNQIVWIGSANLTEDAMYNNIENVYLVKDQRLAKEIHQAHVKLWNAAIEPSLMPRRNSAPANAPQ